MEDLYYSIASKVEGVFYKEKSSKFIGYAYPVEDETAIEQALQEVKKLHPKARHFCYAWQLAQDYSRYRANDDGEPSHSAGIPIYGQLQSKQLTNCLVVVVRYFGGTKLGVGGLISAYKTTAQLTLEAATITTHTIDVLMAIRCAYDLLHMVMRMVEEYNIQIVKQNLGIDCYFELAVRKNNFERIFEKFSSVYGFQLKRME